MDLIPPSENILKIVTARLVLEPIAVEHAKDMLQVLADPKLYAFVPQDLPELEKLQRTYELWSKRVSPAGDEIWLNWAARLRETGQLVGHFQAGYKKADHFKGEDSDEFVFQKIL